MEVTIKKIENSKFNSSKIAYFDFLGKEKYTIISSRVLKFLKLETIDQIKLGTKLEMFKSFNSSGKDIYLCKKVLG